MKKCKADLEKLRNVIDMEEVRKYKSEMKQMRKEMAELVKTGRYIRDDQRLVLSAPEIIIGDVDPFGVMNEFTRSKVILRGSVVSLEAPGEVGRVNLRASTIYERAENPGIDGLEHLDGAGRHVAEVTYRCRNQVKHYSSSKSSGISMSW